MLISLLIVGTEYVAVFMDRAWNAHKKYLDQSFAIIVNHFSVYFIKMVTYVQESRILIKES